MSGEEIMTSLFVALAAFAAIGIAVVKNVFNAALLLIVCLLSIAGLYLLLHAEFLGAVQIMIYSGGIVVLILFGIMLTVRLSGKKMDAGHRHTLAGAFAALVLLAFLVMPISRLTPTRDLPVQDMAAHMHVVGQSLFIAYSFPFEVAGFLLLMSLIAASVIATHRIGKKNS